jgi:uncharacterized phage protein gp47/JayE
MMVEYVKSLFRKLIPPLHPDRQMDQHGSVMGVSREMAEGMWRG